MWPAQEKLTCFLHQSCWAQIDLSLKKSVTMRLVFWKKVYIGISNYRFTEGIVEQNWCDGQCDRTGATSSGTWWQVRTAAAPPGGAGQGDKRQTGHTRTSNGWGTEPTTGRAIVRPARQTERHGNIMPQRDTWRYRSRYGGGEEGGCGGDRGEAAEKAQGEHGDPRVRTETHKLSMQKLKVIAEKEVTLLFELVHAAPLADAPDADILLRSSSRHRPVAATHHERILSWRWRGHLPYKKLHQSKCWLSLLLGHKKGYFGPLRLF